MFLVKRREFLKKLGLSAAALSSSRLLNPLFSFATDPSTLGGKNLILLNLAGGFDSFAAFPYLLDPNVSNQADGFVQYLNTNRPATFVLPRANLLDASSHSYLLNSYLGFAPAFAPLEPIWQANKIRLNQSIGIIGDLSGSHNYCENCYSFGDPNFVGGVSRGWYARLIELLNLTDHQAYGFGTFSRIDFVTSDPQKAPVAGMRTEDLTWDDPIGGSRSAINLETSRALLEAATISTSADAKLKAALSKGYDTVEFMTQVNTDTGPGKPLALVGSYPAGSIGDTCKSIARLISFLENEPNPKNRAFYAYEGGFDTHGNQGGADRTSGVVSGALHNHLSNVALAIKALVDDLQNRGVWEKTVIILFSEFSRTAKQNGGAGTDHGAASTHLVMGGPVNGGVYGQAPTRADLMAKNCYPARLDFQNEFAAAVRWFAGAGVDEQIFPPGTYVLDPGLYGGLISA
ncbi:MAG: DUF1501 domain-containing protein [Deltaproteobacteria bacterium]|nr:DUF1501 domain-containing protein [Deltaproteobacteria bacterium]